MSNEHRLIVTDQEIEWLHELASMVLQQMRFNKAIFEDNARHDYRLRHPDAGRACVFISAHYKTRESEQDILRMTLEEVVCPEVERMGEAIRFKVGRIVKEILASQKPKKKKKKVLASPYPPSPGLVARRVMERDLLESEPHLPGDDEPGCCFENAEPPMPLLTVAEIKAAGARHMAEHVRRAEAVKGEFPANPPILHTVEFAFAQSMSGRKAEKYMHEPRGPRVRRY